MCWAVLRCGAHIRVLEGGAPSKGHGGGRLCRGLWVPCTVRLLATSRLVHDTITYSVACAVRYSIFAAPGPKVVCTVYVMGALDASRALPGPHGIHQWEFVITGISQVRIAAEHPRLWQVVGGVLCRGSQWSHIGAIPPWAGRGVVVTSVGPCDRVVAGVIL